jgi:hypothetical protein
MSALDEITKEKQRISEALARIDAQRDKLAGELSELEATERVLARYSKGTPSNRTSARKAPTTAREGAAQAQSTGRRRTTTAKSARGDRGSPSLTDQVLAFATGKTQQEIAQHAKALARTMSAPPSPGTSGPAASRSGTASSMPSTRRQRSNTPRSDVPAVVTPYRVRTAASGIIPRALEIATLG